MGMSRQKKLEKALTSGRLMTILMAGDAEEVSPSWIQKKLKKLYWNYFVYKSLEGPVNMACLHVLFNHSEYVKAIESTSKGYYSSMTKNFSVFEEGTTIEIKYPSLFKILKRALFNPL